ncbi:hypothetical protein F4808DRAFT_421934 [Astrocystis sublimbata]|nr:hypothetical protein F4808DRAFT_421934 [Astrocystis sublimbata]
MSMDVRSRLSLAVFVFSAPQTAPGDMIRRSYSSGAVQFIDLPTSPRTRRSERPAICKEARVIFGAPKNANPYTVARLVPKWMDVPVSTMQGSALPHEAPQE